ncbi:hypothetical protein [Pseudomonas pharyngis]|uniref:hypothetical protein n=1 Tax=Pseudomonas pharyngis TaxID=2892333 RepID=UPI003FD241D3
MAKFSFTNVQVDKCGGAGISLPHDATATFDTVFVTNCGEGIIARDPASVWSALGLPSDIDPQLVAQVLQSLSANAGADDEQKARITQQSELGHLLQNAANWTTIASNLIQLSASMYCQQAIDFFKGLSR